jgi:hypothetical protein
MIPGLNPPSLSCEMNYSLMSNGDILSVRTNYLTGDGRPGYTGRLECRLPQAGYPDPRATNMRPWRSNPAR